MKRGFLYYGLGQPSAKTYASSLKQFCKYASVSSFNFPAIGLERIETWHLTISQTSALARTSRSMGITVEEKNKRLTLIQDT